MDIETLTLKRDENWDIPVETEDEAIFFLEAYEGLRERAAPIAKALMELEHEIDTGGVDGYDIEYDSGSFTYTYEKYRCGATDTYEVDIPLAYLFDPDWIDQANLKIEERNERDRKWKIQQAMKDQERQEKRDLEQYKKLKEKFEQ